MVMNPFSQVSSQSHVLTYADICSIGQILSFLRLSSPLTYITMNYSGSPLYLSLTAFKLLPFFLLWFLLPLELEIECMI